VHLRRVHYRNVGGERYQKHDGTPYENTEGCGDYLGEAGKYVRYLDLVRPDALKDHRTPPPPISMADNPVRLSPGAELTVPEDWTRPWVERDLGALLSLPLPEVETVAGYADEAND
jgi:hypothetical protein